MTPVFCSKGHENAASNVYCQQCGEKLDRSVGNAGKGIYPGAVLGDRYHILQQLGHGGFGRTYLSEDTNRFRELCVLKEFAPQVQGTYAMQKAAELFEREAGVLYKLQHPQIPRFRELLRVKQEDQGYLLLVQDYVEGQTYRALLETRKRQGQRFNEVEVTQLMLQLLPVLEYIHSLGVVHRDISPDNVILRNADYLPVLIDFGGVKQVSANAESQFTQASGDPHPSLATRLGKIGYAPNEQMQVGVAYPHSDLYALAATVLVLLTGKEPQQLIDPHNMIWNWRREVSLSLTLSQVLDKMLAYRPGDRYQSAREVIQALTPPIANNIAPTQPPSSPPSPTQPPVIPTPASPTTAHATLAVSPGGSRSHHTPATTPAASNSQPNIRSNSHSNNFLGKVALISVLVLLAGGVGWVFGNQIIGKSSNRKPTPQPTEEPGTQNPEPPPAPQFSKEERDRKQALKDKRESLGIDYNFYASLVNELFWQRNPSLKNRSLSSDPKDEQLRKQWDEIGRQWLDKLAFLSNETRRRLGGYGDGDLSRWKAEVNKRYLSSRALYDLADAEFFYRFPEQRNKKFIEKPIGQVWYAIVDRKVKAVQNGSALQRIVFPAGAIGDEVKGTLPPGEGKAFIANLAAGQQMNVNLQADPNILFSVYPPNSNQKAFLEDSAKRSWSGTLPSKGFYEFVVTSKASKSLDYRINLTAENPAPPPPPEPTPSPTPTETVVPSPTVTETPTPSPTVTETPTPSPTVTETPNTPPDATDSPTPDNPTPTDTPPSPENTPSEDQGV
ncbi:MAG TPA: serine/threonine-protein kinase [Leptolyngbyaceae cyanobacterium]